MRTEGNLCVACRPNKAAPHRLALPFLYVSVFSPQSLLLFILFFLLPLHIPTHLMKQRAPSNVYPSSHPVGKSGGTGEGKRNHKGKKYKQQQHRDIRSHTHSRARTHTCTAMQCLDNHLTYGQTVTSPIKRADIYGLLNDFDFSARALLRSALICMQRRLPTRHSSLCRPDVSYFVLSPMHLTSRDELFVKAADACLGRCGGRREKTGSCRRASNTLQTSRGCHCRESAQESVHAYVTELLKSVSQSVQVEREEVGGMEGGLRRRA